MKVEKVVAKVNIDDQSTDFAYWQTQPYETRLAILEEIRREYHTWIGGDEGAQGMIASQDFKEFVQALNDNNVRYLIIGGYAVAFHGHPRYTKDLDVWIELSQENGDNLVKAIAQFGFGSLGLTSEDFLEPDQIIQLGYPPNRIDILNTLKGVTFEECYKARVETTFEGIDINFIDLDNLRKNKQATGRLQDLADLEKLQ